MPDVQEFAQGMQQAEIAYWIPLNQIKPDPNQPRKFFDPEGMEELKGSIAENKQRLPIHVRPSPTFEQNQEFIIVSGERRYIVATELGQTHIRAFIMVEAGIDTFNWSFIENYNRRGFTPMEEAQAMLRYLNEGLTQTEIAKKIGRSAAHVAQMLLLNELPIPLQEKVATRKLAATTGFLLVRQCATQDEMLDVVAELVGPLKHGYDRLTTGKVKSHIERRRQMKKQQENGDTLITANRKELAKCLEPAATALFGLLDEALSIGEENPEAFTQMWDMIPKPKRSGLEATLEAIRVRIEKIQHSIALSK